VVDITTLKLTTGPAVFLFLGGLSVFCVHITENLVAAMQHFAAGIVVCAISMELMPPILEARGDLSVVTTITVGFFLGVFCVFIFDSLCETEDETDESEEFYGLRDSSRRGYGTVSGFERDGKGVLSVLSSRRRSGKASLARQTSAIDVVYPFPYSLVFAVCIDALVDGLLIGVSTIQGQKAGLILGIALTVEMCFLGITLATGLRSQRFYVAVISLLFTSGTLVLGGQLGASFSAAIKGNEVVEVGVLSFGTSALLYLVTEELLIEAHKAGDHALWIDICFFLGFWACLVLEKFSS